MCRNCLFLERKENCPVHSVGKAEILWLDRRKYE
uniref:Uncharacterized protein n=1 Tax=Anguilla anguilla TaxID=7936 RepID=A0A0E9W1P9_ANGAN